MTEIIPRYKELTVEELDAMLGGVDAHPRDHMGIRSGALENVAKSEPWRKRNEFEPIGTPE